MKTLDFPVESYTFSKDKLHFILDNLETTIAYFIKEFGQTAQFKLSLNLQHIPRKPKPKKTLTTNPKKAKL